MTDPDEYQEIEEIPAGDVEMAENAENVEGQAAEETAEAVAETTDLPFQGEEVIDPRSTFLSYLTSPTITLIVGRDNPTHLTAHQALLSQSPYFQDLCSAFVDDGSPRQIELLDEHLDAVGCCLEFLYTGEYFPKKLHGQRALESDPSIAAVDDTGEHMLKHARVATLGGKFGLNKLKTLATSKIHCINSTAKGEIVYARYVYAHTTKEDTAIRAPVSVFWATRSHTLRAEAEEEFKGLCLEYPEFGYDVLTRVLDDKLKRERTDKMHPATSTGRKRARHSSGGSGA